MNTIIIENINDQEILSDVYAKLSEGRILFLTGTLTDDTASDLCSSLIYQDNLAQDKITIFINSEGGDVRNILMLYDTIRIMRSPIETVCVGAAANEISVILASGTKGLRFATRNSFISMSQLTNDKVYYTDVTDAKTILNQAKDDNRRLMQILSSVTGKKVSELMKLFDRKVYFNALQAKKFGFIDEVI